MTLLAWWWWQDMDTARFAVHVDTDEMGEQELASNLQEWIIHRYLPHSDPSPPCPYLARCREGRQMGQSMPAHREQGH